MRQFSNNKFKWKKIRITRKNNFLLDVEGREIHVHSSVSYFFCVSISGMFSGELIRNEVDMFRQLHIDRNSYPQPPAALSAYCSMYIGNAFFMSYLFIFIVVFVCVWVQASLTINNTKMNRAKNEREKLWRRRWNNVEEVIEEKTGENKKITKFPNRREATIETNML